MSSRLFGGWCVWEKNPHLSFAVNSWWCSRLMSERARLQRLSGDLAPELVLDLCSLLAGCPTALWLNAVWHIFNRSVTFFFCTAEYMSKWLVSQEGCWFLLSFSCCLLPGGNHFVVSKKRKRHWSITPVVMAGLAFCLNTPQNIMTPGILEANLSKCPIGPVKPFAILVMSQKQARCQTFL